MDKTDPPPTSRVRFVDAILPRDAEPGWEFVAGFDAGPSPTAPHNSGGRAHRVGLVERRVAPDAARLLNELACAAEDILAELHNGFRDISVVERSASAGRLRAAVKRAREGAR